MFQKIVKKKEHMFSILIIVIFVLGEIFLVTRKGKVYMSLLDYYKQSVAFAHYFRNLFYETGNLFPNFAPHIGAGENIYYFAYYGLFSPFTLFSYLLPFVNMVDYIMTIMIINIIVSGILMYVFLLKNHFRKKSSLIGALLLVSSCSFLFYSQRHIMFTNYMSFFLLSFIGVKIYHEKGRSTLLIVSVFLLLLTSYYFSIPCILCLFLYDLYLNIDNCLSFKTLLRKEIQFALRILISILLACFLLLPIVYTLTARMDTTSSTIDILSLLVPRVLSRSRSIGLNVIVFIALWFHFCFLHRRGKILIFFLFCLFSIPIFDYLLNGCMYLDAKVFISFIPIIVFFIVNTFENIDKLDNWKFCLFIVTAVLFLFLFFSILGKKIFFLDALFFHFILLFLYKKRKRMIYLFPIVFLCSTFSIQYFKHATRQASIEDYKIYRKTITQVQSELLNQETSIYRYQEKGDEYINASDGKNLYLPTVYSSIKNPYYTQVFHNSFYNNFKSRNFATLSAMKNPFYLRFMGIKYNYTSEEIYGYEQVTQKGEKNLYVNENVFPIGYFRNELLKKEEYMHLSSIEKLQAYQNNIIVDKESSNANLEFMQEEVVFDLNELLEQNFIYEEKEEHFTFDTKEQNFVYKLREPFENKTLIIQFQVNNNPLCDEEEIIKINGIRNILTCDTYTYHNGNHTFNYVISSENIEELKIEITRGYYDISDVKVYTIDNAFFENIPEVAFQFDKEKTKGDSIEGTVVAPEEGYVLFTIPYDKGFTLYVDGELGKIEKVNEGFIGFKVGKGEHKVKLKFIAPYSQVGKIISIFGILCFLCFLYYEKNHLDKEKTIE